MHRRIVQLRVRSGIEVRPGQVGGKVIEALQAAFRVENPAWVRAEKMKAKWRFGLDRWIEDFRRDPQANMFVFPREARAEFKAVLEIFGLGVELVEEPLEVPVEFPEPVGEVGLWEHQHRMMEAALKAENCLIRAITGAGKTVCAFEIIRRAGQRALVVVPSVGLMRQWLQTAERLWCLRDGDVGGYGGGRKDLGRVLTVGVIQSVSKMPASTKESFGTILVDEVHKAAAPTVRSIVGSFPARYRIGMSSDEKRKDGLEILIRHHFGSIAEIVGRTEMEEAGVLVPVDVRVVPTAFRFPLLERLGSEELGLAIMRLYPQIAQDLERDPARNQQVVELADRILRIHPDRCLIVFCNRIAQSRQLAADIRESGHACGLMLGGPSNRVEYDRSKDRLLQGQIRCVVATSAAFAGEDLPPLTDGLVVTPTASNRQLLDQQVGRIRRSYPGKKKAFLWYLWDQHVFRNHIDRLRRYYGRAVKIDQE